MGNNYNFIRKFGQAFGEVFLGNNYNIIRKLGEGAFGEVFLVEKDNKYYALKKIHIIVAKLTENQIEEYKKMIKILSELNNEYIIKYYDSFIKDDYFCILMEYGVNINIKQFIKKHKDESQFIDKNIIIDIIRQICKGLKTIHENNIIHRDLTPDNIFLDGNNKIKIGDFGVSKLLNTNNHYSKTKTGVSK